MKLISLIKGRFETKDRGATAVEYGLMVALIAVAIIAAVLALGGQLTAIFEYVTEKIGEVMPA
ncbi:Flp family type IVb pilin [Isoptericola variabilis]|uniref:Flp/Fap pilin component n=1 Tax=Isoptericola variabilis (strain 225) TaxID=743718 RepID=F6FQU2_ISOV2|nr:Flp family type IVb pilin [Isoptericola variabilis]AEG42907.1 Flp/Fap pilin component [Isoptericola variabilis 225]TWH31844.1 pilus assembly protein Flp/PilA [Isoptericola variabilis J7]